MTLLQALILGIVEGLTEFLPVSSTGHLILVGHWLGADDPRHKAAADAFEVVIQLGALLAVVVHYRRLLAQRLVGLVRNEPASRGLALALAMGFLPAALMGYLFHETVEARLFGPLPVAIALVTGGLVMMLVEVLRRRSGESGLTGLEHVTPRRALLIGLGQCFSLWPGTSRSMTTIVAGQAAGLSTATAAEFSFLLAVPTLGAATVYKLAQSSHELLGAPGGALALIIGLVVSFLVAWAVIAAFLRYLRTWGLLPFGAYRVLLGAIVFALLAR